MYNRIISSSRVSYTACIISLHTICIYVYMYIIIISMYHFDTYTIDVHVLSESEVNLVVNCLIVCIQPCLRLPIIIYTCMCLKVLKRIFSWLGISTKKNIKKKKKGGWYSASFFFRVWCLIAFSSKLLKQYVLTH